MTQRPLRILTVAPVPAERPPPTLADLEIAPDGAGGYLLTRDASPERRRELERLVWALRPREPDASTAPVDPAAFRASARATLRTFAGRPRPVALALAGRLYVAHGDEARRALARDWRPDWAATWAAVDALLAAAGLPAADTLPTFRA